MCTWHEQLAALARPLVEAMFVEARTEPYVCVDATGVLVQAKERCRVGHFWVLVAPEKHVLYRYSREHNGAAVDRLLPGYAGYLVADAHVVYGIEPLGYMRDLLCLLPRWPSHRLLELAPVYAPKTFDEPEARDALAANPFRRIILGHSDLTPPTEPTTTSQLVHRVDVHRGSPGPGFLDLRRHWGRTASGSRRTMFATTA
jgi:hypothetical protein